MTRFRLGYDPNHDCVVLPCEDGRCVRRAVSEKRYLNEKGRPSPLFQPELLTGAGEGDLIFLLEGTFDALSAEELGYRAAALNGSGNPGESRRPPAHPVQARSHSAADGQRPGRGGVGLSPDGGISVALPLSPRALWQGSQRIPLP